VIGCGRMVVRGDRRRDGGRVGQGDDGEGVARGRVLVERRTRCPRACRMLSNHANTTSR